MSSAACACTATATRRSAAPTWTVSNGSASSSSSAPTWRREASTSTACPSVTFPFWWRPVCLRFRCFAWPWVCRVELAFGPDVFGFFFFFTDRLPLCSSDQHDAAGRKVQLRAPHRPRGPRRPHGPGLVLRVAGAPLLCQVSSGRTIVTDVSTNRANEAELSDCCRVRNN